MNEHGAEQHEQDAVDLETDEVAREARRLAQSLNVQTGLRAGVTDNPVGEELE
jgi:hypothetical protein